MSRAAVVPPGRALSPCRAAQLKARCRLPGTPGPLLGPSPPPSEEDLQAVPHSTLLTTEGPNLNGRRQGPPSPALLGSAREPDGRWGGGRSRPPSAGRAPHPQVTGLAAWGALSTRFSSAFWMLPSPPPLRLGTVSSAALGSPTPHPCVDKSFLCKQTPRFLLIRVCLLVPPGNGSGLNRCWKSNLFQG